MDAVRRLPLALVAVVLLAQTPGSPSPTPEPVVEIHRTAHAAHDPGSGLPNPLFVLVVGSDIREGDPARGRADSLHVVAVNTNTGEGTIVGIPRDSYVAIPGLGRRKINSALSLGGPERTAQAVSELGGIPIHYWALTEFSRFRQLVDRLGGLDVEVPYPMADRWSGAFFEPGRRHMDGAEVLAFTRARKTIPGGDFGRSENHGRVLLAALEKFKTEVGGPLSLLPYFQAFRDLVVTDVPVGELIGLALVAQRLDPAAVTNIVLPASGSDSVGGSSVVLLGGGAQEIFDRIRDDGVL